jgi:hypothetical protein
MLRVGILVQPPFNSSASRSPITTHGAMVLPVVTRGTMSVIINSPFGLLNSLIAFHLQLDVSYHKSNRSGATNN